MASGVTKFRVTKQGSYEGHVLLVPILGYERPLPETPGTLKVPFNVTISTMGVL